MAVLRSHHNKGIPAKGIVFKHGLMAYRGHVYDGEVQVAADQLFLQDGGVGLRDKDFDGRALLFEFGQYLGQYDGTQVRRDPQVNPAGFQIVQVADRHLQVPVYLQNLVGGLVILFSDIGQRQPARRPVEQRSSKRGLQPLERLAQRGLGDKQFLGRLGHVSDLGDCLYIEQFFACHKNSPIRICILMKLL